MHRYMLFRYPICEHRIIYTLYDIIVTTLPYTQIPPYLTLFYDKVLGFSYQHIGWGVVAKCIYAVVWKVKERQARERERASILTTTQ